MDGRPAWTDFDEAVDYVVPNYNYNYFISIHICDINNFKHFIHSNTDKKERKRKKERKKEKKKERKKERKKRKEKKREKERKT